MKIKFLHASSAHRWWECAGSVRAEMIAPEVDGEAGIALEGTAAHRLLELCLKKRVEAELYVGETVRLPREKVDFEVTEEMAEHIQAGVDLIRRRRGKGVLWTESEVGAVIRGVHVGGTLDAGWYGLYKNEIEVKGAKPKKLNGKYKAEEWQLHILDLKYGYLMVEELKKNRQLWIYARGKLRELQKDGKKVDSIHLWIYQPRVDSAEGPFKHVVIRPYELAEFEIELDEKVEAVLKPRAKLTAGRWCLYCRAQGVCLEAERAVLRIVRSKFSEDDTGRVGELMFLIPFVLGWAKSLKALANTMGFKGSPPIGWVMGRGRRSRRWTGEKDDWYKAHGATLRKRFGLKDDDFAPRKLVGPAKARALVAEGKRDLFDKLWFWTQGKEVLQPADNARQAITMDTFFDSHDDGREE